MRDFVIMTDSCCDLTAEEVAEAGLTVVPLTFTMDGVSRPDLPDHSAMPLEEFYRHIREGASCVTAAVNVGAFSDAMRSILTEGRDILCVCFSSALSTTYQSAVIAAEELKKEFHEARIEVIDSLSAARGQGMLVWNAAKEKAKGKTLAETAGWVRETIPHLNHWFTVADLGHLRRGGRLNATSAIIGTVLSIKPILHVDAEGRLTPVGKTRGMKQAVNELLNKLQELGQRPLDEQTVFLSHADAPELVDYATEQLRVRFGITDVRVGYIGPVIGSHTGAGTIALFFLGTER